VRVNRGLAAQNAYPLLFSIVLDAVLNETADLIQRHLIGGRLTYRPVAAMASEIAGIGDVYFDALVIGLVLSAQQPGDARTDPPHGQCALPHPFPQVALDRTGQERRHEFSKSEAQVSPQKMDGLLSAELRRVTVHPIDPHPDRAASVAISHWCNYVTRNGPIRPRSTQICGLYASRLVLMHNPISFA